MYKYELVLGSRGKRRPFKVYASLIEKRGEEIIKHTVSEVSKSIMEWLKKRIADNQIFVSLHMTTYEHIFPEGLSSMVELFAEFDPRCKEVVTDEMATDMLNNLASHLGRTLNQSYVFISYCDESWVLQAEK